MTVSFDITLGYLVGWQQFEIPMSLVLYFFFLLVQYLIKKYMESLTDEELKKESKQESKNEVISTIIRVSTFIKVHSAKGETTVDCGLTYEDESFVSLQQTLLKRDR